METRAHQASFVWHSSVFGGKHSGPVLGAMFAVHFPGADITVLDCTWGKGTIWKQWMGLTPEIVGTDLNPAMAKDAAADATRLPFPTNSFDVVVFDPPFRGRPGEWALGDRFGSLTSMPAVYALYREGIKESARVACLGIVVKCQDIVAGANLRHTRWRVIAAGSTVFGRFPQDIAVFTSSNYRLISSKWKTQRHLRRGESYFILWKFGKGERWDPNLLLTKSTQD